MWQIIPGIIARKFMPADAPVIMATVNGNREYLRRWLPWLDSNTELSHFQKYIEDCLSGYRNTSSFLIGLWDETNNCHIGNFGFNRVHEGQAEIGYWLAQNYTGRGIIHHALIWLQKYGCNKFELSRLTIRAATANKKSRQVAEKLEFKLARIIPKNEWLYDHYVDHAEYYKVLHNPQQRCW